MRLRAHAPLDRRARDDALGLKPPPADASTDAEPSDPEKPSAREQASKHDREHEQSTSTTDKHEHERHERERDLLESESAVHDEPKRETLTW